MAPKTPLAARAPAYLDQYGRTLGAAYRFERIQKEIQDEQSRIQYLDSLIGQERQTLAALQQNFATPPANFSEASTLLKNLSDAQAAAVRAASGQRAAAAADITLSKADRDALSRALASDNKTGIVNAVKDIARGATRAKADAALAFVQGRLDSADVTALKAYNEKNANKKPLQAKTGVADAGVTAAQRALEEAYFAGPSGIRGGEEGFAVVNRRNLTADGLAAVDAAAAKALKDSGYATQADAFDAALKVVRETGDPARIPDAYARDIYLEARNKQAYRNDQRADFEQEVLDSRRRLAQLDEERAQIASRYEDPAQEAIKRELIARGYVFAEGEDAWKNRYVQYQNTPYYDVLLNADRLVDTAKRDAKPLGPATKAQNMVTTLAMQYERTGVKFDLDTLRAQLEKAPDLTPTEVDDALSFIVAYRELGGDKQDPKQLEFLRKQEEFQKKSDEQARKRAEALKVEVERARQVTRQLEAEQTRAVSELRTEQAKANLPGQEYARLRAMGMSPEEARAKATRVVTPVETSKAASKVLTEPEFQLERQRRVNAARGEVAEDVVTLPPSRIQLEEEVATIEAPSAPVPTGVAADVAASAASVDQAGTAFQLTMEKARKTTPKAKDSLTTTAPPASAAPAPLRPVKASDALLDALMKMDPQSEGYRKGLEQYNRLQAQGK